MKLNNIRPILILAFVIGSFPLQSADYIPEQSFKNFATTETSSCSSDDKDDSGEGEGKTSRKIASTCL